jgi:hypothetical protein
MGQESAGSGALSGKGTSVVEIRQTKFLSELKRLTKIGLDSSILIYHLENVEPYADLTEATIASIAGGLLKAVVSTISVTELLVQPFAEGREDQVMAFEHFLTPELFHRKGSSSPASQVYDPGPRCTPYRHSSE